MWKLPNDYSRCALPKGGCQLADKCLRRLDQRYETYQAYTAFKGGLDCDGFIEVKEKK